MVNKSKSPFAEFGVRMVAIGIDFYLVLLLIHFIPVIANVAKQTSNQIVVSVVMFLYFFAFWASPMQATPTQYVLRMRIADETGRRLSPGRAAVRSLVLVALIGGIFLLFHKPTNAWLHAIGGAALFAIFLSIVTHKRQGAHDLLTRSVVIVRRVDELYDYPPPNWIRKVTDSIGLVAPVVLLGYVAMMMNDRDMVYRTNYALDSAIGLQPAVEIFYEEEQRWPERGDEIGAASREYYPDGGYYELQDNGVIRIHFEIRPELKNGSMALTPVWQDDEVIWTCHAEGDIKRNHLPAMCRN